MSNPMSIERMLSDWMADEVARGVADEVVDQILSDTGRRRPAPRWLALLQEPPMRLQTQVAVGSPRRRLALTAVLILLALAAAVGVGAAVLLRPQPATVDDWPAFRGDATRAGTSARGPIGRPVVAWQYHAGGAVSNDLAIVGDLVLAPSDDGVLHALAIEDGHERWAFRSSGGPMGGPTVADGTVFVADATGVLTALDLATGQVRWRTAAPLDGPTYAAVGNGSVYVGTSSGSLVALDTQTGVERWRSAVDPSGGKVNIPALAGGRVYVASKGGGFVAVDAVTGTIAWRVDTGDAQTGTAVVAGGIAWIGEPAGASSGRLWAIDIRNGVVLWQVDRAMSPSVAGPMAYAGSNIGVLSARDVATGAERWRFQGGGIIRAPAIAGNVVYAPVDGEQRVYALDAATGGELWQFDLDSTNQCCIAVAQGLVFVGTSTGSVYALGGDGIAVAVQSPGSATVAPAPSSSTATSTSSTSSPSSSATPPPAELIWTATTPKGDLIPTGIVADPSGRLWVADPYHDRFAIFTTDGIFVEFWGGSGKGPGQFDLTRTNGDGYGAIAFEPDGSLFVLDAGNLRIQKFDAQRTFVKTWGGFGPGPNQYQDPVGIAVGPDGRLHVLDDVRGVVETYDPEGKVLGSFDAFKSVGGGAFNGANSLAVDAAGNLYVSAVDPNEVRRFDPNGELTLTYGAPGSGAVAFADQAGSMS
ncbi:MAG TPA: PQQ-binding-like beta-propeller repeat protein, partial [Candidatus Limnocylindrales bacterium]